MCCSTSGRMIRSRVVARTVHHMVSSAMHHSKLAYPNVKAANDDECRTGIISGLGNSSIGVLGQPHHSPSTPLEPENSKSGKTRLLTKRVMMMLHSSMFRWLLKLLSVLPAISAQATQAPKHRYIMYLTGYDLTSQHVGIRLLMTAVNITSCLSHL